MPTHTKLLGDAGEHYTLSMLSFAGRFAAKMPDNWQDYDLVVENGGTLERVSVKTRSQTDKWTESSHYLFDVRDDVQWFVFVLKERKGTVRAWVVPGNVAVEGAMHRDPSSKVPTRRRIMYKQLLRAPFAQYEDNWSLDVAPKS
jgi:hypothetical protein